MTGVYPIITKDNRIGWMASIGCVRNGPFETPGQAERSYKLVATILGECCAGRKS